MCSKLVTCAAADFYLVSAQSDRRSALRFAETNARIRRRLEVWRAIQQLLAGSVEMNGRLEVGASDPETGLSSLTVHRRKSIHHSLRGKPVLLLDAT